MRAVKIQYNDADEIERAIHAFAVEPNGALVVASPPNSAFRDAIYQQAVQHRLPTMSIERIDIGEGGLMYYGPNPENLFRRAAYFVDRILRGAKPSELPVEFPSRFDLIIKLRVAKALGLTIPPNLLARADGVVE
jgi:putative ABC transport system substrate-binding protein